LFNIIFSDEYEVIPAMLVRWRQSAGLSQRELASVLGRSQGHVYRMETRQRPVELVEFCRIASAAGLDPTDALQALLDEIAKVGHEYRRPRQPQRRYAGTRN
jgi:transcriptional regulator with XRE-family HTH domain